jgi:hypothetical protein
MRTRFWAPLAACVAAAAAVAPALLRGEGLLPVGSLWRVPPWNRLLPATSGNGLLSDQLLFFWPWRLYLAEHLRAGNFPFWNPWIAGGAPFLGCVQAAPLHPLNLLLFGLSPAAWSINAAFLKLAAAGVFTALHVRRLGAKPAGAALAGVAFTLSGFMVAWLGHPQANAACLLPALFWAVGGRHWTATALIVGLVGLGGHPPTMLHVLAAAGIYAFFQSRGRAFLAAAAAGFCLAAPALFPYIEYWSLSSGALASQALARWNSALSPWALLHILMPLASGSPVHGAEMLGAAFGWSAANNFLERAAWIGLPTAAFAALALARRGREAETRFHAGVALIGLAAALGVAPLPWLWRALPGFSAANPTRLLLLFCFGAAVLAGLGCDEDGAPASRRALALLSGVLGAALFVYAARVASIWAALEPSERGFAFGQAAAFAAEGAAALWLWARPKARRWAWLVAGIFLLRVAAGVNPSASAALLYPPAPALSALAQEQGEGRVLGLGAAAAPDTSMTAGLRDARGRDFIVLKRYEELLRGRAGDFDFFSSADAVPDVYRLLGVSAVAAGEKFEAAVPPGWKQVYDGELRVFRAPEPGRRALFVPSARWGESPRVLAAVRAKDFDPRATVWLDDWFSAPTPSRSAGSARVVRDEADLVEVSVVSDGPGWVLLLDNWYPGWRAQIDGAFVPLRRADYTFRAVAVPGGKTVVRFTYVPYSFWIGAMLAVLAAAGLVLARLRR